MARARNIKPGFFSNEDLAELPPLTRLLFAGLWTLADREGRLENRPKRIKKDILGYDDCNVVEMIKALEQAGFVHCYEAEGMSLIQIVKWEKHQNPHHAEKKSELPPPVVAPKKDAQAEAKPALAVLIPDSLITDSLNPLPADADDVTDDQVELIRKSYPRPDDAKEARRAIRKAIERERKFRGTRKDAARFLYKRAVVYRAINAEWPPGDRKQFTPLCATWFNKERYNDPDEAYRRTGNHGNKATTRDNENIDAITGALARRGIHVSRGSDLPVREGKRPALVGGAGRPVDGGLRAQGGAGWAAEGAVVDGETPREVKLPADPGGPECA